LEEISSGTSMAAAEEEYTGLTANQALNLSCGIANKSVAGKTAPVADGLVDILRGR
jgi:hypothetical protein